MMIPSVGGEGLEPTTFPAGNAGYAQTGGAESGAVLPEATPADGLDPALALVVRRWPMLTAEQRLAVLEIIAAGVATEAEPGALRVARR
jgi:hypothetical protein